MTTVEDAAATPPGGDGAPTAASQPPLARLRAMYRDGTLTKDFRAARGPLTELAEGADATTDLIRAGQLLCRLDTEAVLQGAAQAGTPLDAVTVSITGHSTLGTLVAPLTAELARHGMVLRARTSDYDAYLRDLRDTGSDLYNSGAELTLCVLDPTVVFDELPHPWVVEDLERTAAAKLAQLDRLAARYVRHATGTLVLNTVPLLRAHTHQLVDQRSRTRLAITWREFNTGLLRLAQQYARVRVLDLDPLIAEGGPVLEPRMASYAKVQLGDELIARYAREVGHLARSLRGHAKKVLVLDLDNTLWDGVLGDDGPDGIAAATTFRGEAFGNFQRIVKQLGSQGVLLAVSSKNDQEPVLQVLREHPDMVLKESDFSRINANWSPKDSNLRDIAEKLNLGLDSFVFADDSPFECGLVRSSLPEVAVVRLDEEPALHIGHLLADGWFDVPELTAEDRSRVGLYRTEAARQELLDSTDSMDDYLAQLGVQVTVAVVGERDLARVAQLSLRTNQFNLTTRRLQPADVRERIEDPDHLVLSIRSADRFGDNGVVGAVFARREADAMQIDNVLLSCRVFARGVEQAALAALLEHARRSGLTAVHARYRPTAKNHGVRDFYPSLGFRRTGETEAGTTFVHDLAELPAVPQHLTLHTDFDGRQQ